MLRPSRLLAVARYEMRCHMTGRQALRLVGVATALLLPAGLVPTPRLQLPAQIAGPGLDTSGMDFGPPPPPKVHVRGIVPPSLESRLLSDELAPVEIRGDHPLVVVTPAVSPDLRAALETIDGEKKVEYREMRVPSRLPGRSLLIAILAVSLLTGPLADAIPGERARRTLEVLLTTGISRSELIGGKWLAWTLWASVTAGVSAGLAVWRGVQAPGWWLLGLPLFIGSAVAFGLWLVRLVDDVVSGSATPMRVLPVAAGTMTALARMVAESNPFVAAALPLGGPLLVAADYFRSGSELAAAGVGSTAFIVVLLARTGRDLDRSDVASGPSRWGAAGLSGVAIVLWWLTVAGPGVWSAGISGTTSDLITPIARSMMVGGLSLLSCAGIAAARESRRRPADVEPAQALPMLVAASLVVPLLLAASGPVPVADASTLGSTVGVMLDRLREASVPVSMIESPLRIAAGLISISGQALLFRGVLATHLGWIVASLLWAVAVAPTAPWTVLPASFAIGALATAFGGKGWFRGWALALLLQLGWSCGAAFALTAAPLRSVACQTMALVIALVALRLGRDAPSRHQL